ncbi:YbaN family protein [Cohaesibacter haloalkalitolerans]|uniref:YbaN family protein n=1 Tax=Cohaesibacter haloalkalitolerans TaxID=1162980 RepID=UPI000E659D05|nr:YbaN family protein [Cohaesibacter haloalkalitolerans]
MKQLKRPFYFLSGLALTAIGIVGAFLPVLPSTVFFIMAAFCFTHSSPRLEAWILDHQLFGPPVVAWRDHGAISRRAKYFAFGGMAFGFAMFIVFARPGVWLLLPVMLFFAASALYVGTRPDGPKD